jgi:hypothetical protein
MSASKIAHRRLSGRAGSITQPIAIAADVDRGAQISSASSKSVRLREKNE